MKGGSEYHLTDLSDIMNKLDRWDVLIRDYAMKFNDDNISDKMRREWSRTGWLGGETWTTMRKSAAWWMT